MKQKTNHWNHFLVFIILTSLLSSFKFTNEDWTHFRGSKLNGIANVKSCPISWSPDSNIVWKNNIHGIGWSSPVVYDDQIWLTTATEDGKEMSAVCIDYNSGETLFDKVVFKPDSIYRKHTINSYATPTPCIEQDYVYVHFGKYGTACLKTQDGSLIWKRNDIECLHVQGPGSSPIIYKNLLILHLEGTDRQLITALDKTTGETIWETERPKSIYDNLQPIGKKAYITPLIIQVKGQDCMISNGSAACMAYDPMTGKEIWRIIRGVDSTIAMPFSDGKTVFFHTGFEVEESNKYAELMAVDPDGKGDIAASNIRWKIRTPVLQLSTPVLKDGLIYNVDTKNIMMCLDAQTGETIWSHRLKGKYNASPIIAAGHVYFTSTNGKTTVIKEGKELEIITENSLDGEIWTTPVAIGENLLIRTSKYLYRIGN